MTFLPKEIFSRLFAIDSHYCTYVKTCDNYMLTNFIMILSWIYNFPRLVVVAAFSEKSRSFVQCALH